MTALAMEGNGVGQLASLRRAGIYTRVSEDRTKQERSPEEQENDGRRDCDRFKFDVVTVYRDTVGASRHTSKHKVRGDWLRLKDDLANGRLDVVVAWGVDRAIRKLGDFDELAELCREHGVLLLVNGRIYDVDKPEDEFSLSLEAILAVREANVLRKRVLRALNANALAGLPHGRKQWGYARQHNEHGALLGQVPDDDEAPAVREAFDRVAAGDTLRSIARDFDARGITAPGGACSPNCTQTKTSSGRKHVHRDGTWGDNGATKLRQALTNVVYLGHRVSKGDVIRNEDGTPKICWTPLVTQDVFDRVQDRLAYQARHRSNAGYSHGARHLLSGLITCGTCGGPVVHTSVGHRRDEPIAVYKCKRAGHLGRKAEWLDEAVSDLIVGWATNPSALDKLAKSNGAKLATVTRELEELQARLTDAEDTMADGKITAAAFGRLEARLLPKITALADEQRVLRYSVSTSLRDMIGEHAQQYWDAANIDAKRAIVREALELRLVPLKGTGNTGLGLAYIWKQDEERTEHYL